MSYTTHMTAARNGDYTYDSSRRSRSRAQVKRLRTTPCGTTTSWDEVADVRNSITPTVVGYVLSNTTKVVMDDLYADLRDCLI